MKIYVSFFKMRFINGLQYRVAAYAGMTTQFAWGFMNILMFNAFYRSNPSAMPMEMSELSTYIWLQQAFLALFMVWNFDNDIFDSITSGNVAYEMCRPSDIYTMWYAKCLAGRFASVVQRCVPILVVAVFLKAPYSLMGPDSLLAFVLFVISILLGTSIVVAFTMIVYAVIFYTISPLGVRMIAISVVEFLAGAIIPLPFLPDSVRKVFELLPFASMQSTPFLIYNGFKKGEDVVIAMLLQIFWLAFMVGIGKLLMSNALKKVVVQGG